MARASKDLSVEITGSKQEIAVVRLTRGAKRNALSDGLLLALRDAFQNRFRLPHDARPMENSRRADRHDRLVHLGALSPRHGGAGGAAGDHAAGLGAHGLGVCRLRPPGRDHGGRRAGDERRAGENGRRRRVGGSPDSAQRRAADHSGGARQRWRAAVGLHEQCRRTGADDASRPGSTVTQMGWRLRYGVNLLAISREGGRSIQRLPSAPLAGGDVLLLQGRDDAIASLAGDLGLVPLAERNLRIRNKREAIMPRRSCWRRLPARLSGWCRRPWLSRWARWP